MTGQNIARQESQLNMRRKKVESREMPAAAGEARCEVTSHKPHGKI